VVLKLRQGRRDHCEPTRTVVQKPGLRLRQKRLAPGSGVDAQPCFIVSLFCAVGGLPAEALIAGPASQLGTTDIFATML
jgi:hypothetical protein